MLLDRFDRSGYTRIRGLTANMMHKPVPPGAADENQDPGTMADLSHTAVPLSGDSSLCSTVVPRITAPNRPTNRAADCRGPDVALPFTATHVLVGLTDT